MSKLSNEQVEHIAELAKLGLTDEEKERFRVQLSAILEYAEILQRLDTEAIPPTAQVLGLRNVMRPDEVAPGLPLEEALVNAPAQTGGYFRVLPILEEL